MLKSSFSKQRIEKMGSYIREYDAYSEEGEREEIEVIADVLSWLKDERFRSDTTQNNQSDDIKELMAAGYAFSDNGPTEVIHSLQRTVQNKFIIGKSYDLLEEIGYNTLDIVSGRKVKTSVTITASIAIGLTVGFIVGTFVLPGIGSAAGGAIGAGIAAAVGNGLGAVMTILGGLFGSWVGKKISNRAFKHEKRYELSTKVSRNITAQVGITAEVSTMINAYLYNRGKTITSPLCKEYYKLLRRSLIKDANPIALDMAINFFCREWELLNKELISNISQPELKKEIKAVKFILNALAEVERTSPRSRRKIKNTLQGLKAKSIIKMPKYDSEESLPAFDSHVKQRFIKKLHKPKYGITNVQSVEETDFSTNSIIHRYKIQHQNGERLPDVVFSKKEEQNTPPVAEVMVDKSLVTDQNKKLVSQVLTEQVKAYCEKAPNSRLTIVAGGDDALAIQLLKVALKAGLEAELDDEEYPRDNKEMAARREYIIEQAQSALKRSRAPTRTVGFKLTDK